MFYINMAIAIILSQVVPISSTIISILRLFPSFIKGLHLSHTTFGIIMLLITLSILYSVTHLVTKHNKLRERLPNQIPGTNFIISGLILYVLFKAVLIFASTIEGGGAAYTVRQLGIFVIYPAYILMCIGIYKAYKALNPINS